MLINWRIVFKFPDGGDRQAGRLAGCILFCLNCCDLSDRPSGTQKDEKRKSYRKYIYIYVSDRPRGRQKDEERKIY